jgi:glycosyltransferase involved in cell wall biosynthesis
MTPRVAVIIPCFNDGGTVEEAVASALMQEECELVVVDDGTTDVATLLVLGDLERRGIPVLHQLNRGVAAARMAGVHATSAPYVVPLDADDDLLPNALTVLADTLDAQPGAAAAWGILEMFGDVRVRFPTAEAVDPWLTTYVNALPITAMFRREALLTAGGWQLRMGYEDWDLWMAFAERGYTGVRVPQVTHRYRLHGPRKWRSEVSQRHDEIYAELRRRHPLLFENRHRNWRRSVAPWRLKLGLPIIMSMSAVPARVRAALAMLLGQPRVAVRVALGVRLTRARRALARAR